MILSHTILLHYVKQRIFSNLLLLVGCRAPDQSREDGPSILPLAAVGGEGGAGGAGMGRGAGAGGPHMEHLNTT